MYLLYSIFVAVLAINVINVPYNVAGETTTEELEYAETIKADPHPIKYNLDDPSDSGIFIGRQAEFNFVKWMHYSDKLFVLTGPSGVGKSALARMYGKSYKGNVLWIDCETNNAMLKSFFEIAHILDIPTNTKISTLIYNVLAYFEHKKSLFIFDDAKPDNVVVNSLKTLIGNSIHISLIITSKDTNWDTEYFHILKMENFTKDEAISYLKRALQNLDLPDNKETCEELEMLAENLTYNPGALHKASKYIKRRFEDNEHYKIENFVNELELYLNPTKMLGEKDDKKEDDLPKIMKFLEDLDKDLHVV